MPVRLKNAVLRIVARSKHRAYYLPQKEQLPGASTPPHVRVLTLAVHDLRQHASPTLCMPSSIATSLQHHTEVPAQKMQRYDQVG